MFWCELCLGAITQGGETHLNRFQHKYKSSTIKTDKALYHPSAEPYKLPNNQ